MSLSDEITNSIGSFQQLPYLFVGTGMSMRYADAPSWDALLFDSWGCVREGNQKAYDKLRQGIEYELSLKFPNTSEEDKKYYANPQLATEIQKIFNQKFYNDDSFEGEIFNLEQVNTILKNRFDPFKFYIAEKMKSVIINVAKSEYKEIAFLSQNQNKFAGIITTNYDCVLENIFSDFSVNVGQDNILVSNTNNISEMFKIHGSLSDPNSIVITKDDYDYFDKKLKYLSAKLLTIFVEHPIIFLGYGLGDLNIIKLFSEIAECLNAEQLERSKNNFLFISQSTDGNEGVQSKELSFGTKRIRMTEFILNDYSVLYQKFDLIKATVPVKIMRKLQNMITKFIYSTETKNNILFGNINSPNIDDNRVALYIGDVDSVSQIGFDSFKLMDILEDVLFDNKDFLIDKKLIRNTFKNIRNMSGSTYLPIYKYISALGMTINDIPPDYLVVKSYKDVAPNNGEKSYIKKEVNFTSVDDIVKAFPGHFLKQIANIKQNAALIDTESLGRYLKDNYNDTTFMTKHISAFKRLTVLFDYKKYGENKEDVIP